MIERKSTVEKGDTTWNSSRGTAAITLRRNKSEKNSGRASAPAPLISTQIHPDPENECKHHSHSVKS